MSADDAIWSPEQIRVMAERAVSSVGGPTGWRAIGPTMRRAVVARACWEAVRTASVLAPVTVTDRQVNALERAMRHAAARRAGFDMGDEEPVW